MNYHDWDYATSGYRDKIRELEWRVSELKEQNKKLKAQAKILLDKQKRGC